MDNMNYYPFHIGDYITVTKHLTVTEHGAFRLLLDMYYSTEKPLPLDIDRLCKLLLVRSDDERNAVSTVLNEFFTKTESGWVNQRCDEEIETYRSRIEKARQSGKASAKARIKHNQELTEIERPFNDRSTTVQRPFNDRSISSSTNQYPVTNTKTSKETTLSGKPDVSKEIIEYLNASTGKHFRCSRVNTDLVKARLKEGASPADLKTVIDRQVLAWRDDTKMREYLRPATLFNRTKFEQYLGASEPERKEWI